MLCWVLSFYEQINSIFGFFICIREYIVFSLDFDNWITFDFLSSVNFLFLKVEGYVA